MKAKISTRIHSENRTKLETVIPLEVPFHVFLDPSDVCNFRCKFCPTGNTELIKKAGRKPRLMDFELYKKIIADLCALGKPLKVLRMYKDGEPLLNPRFPEMVRYAKESGCALEVDTTTNASLLTPELNLKLVEAGLDRVYISLEGLSAKTYESFAGYKLDFDKFVGNIRHLYENRKQCKVCVKIVGDDFTEADKKLYFETFGDICDQISIEHVAPCWPEFKSDAIVVNNEVGIYGQKIKEVQVCPYIFYSLSINSDGKVSLCFLDWARKMIVGDINTQSFKEIWNGEKLYEYRKMHLLKQRKGHPICGACGQLSHCLPDDIDAHAQGLLEKLEKARAKS